MTFLVEALGGAPVPRHRVELVERKGLGHPDTICDRLVEAVSVALAAMYVERTGVVLHHNVDKALLVAGAARKGFGWGEITRPMELIVGDRATFEARGQPLPVEATVHAAVDAWVGAHLPGVRVGRDLVTRVALAAGSAELQGIFAGTTGTIASNDTSGAAGYAPLSPTEQLVLDAERFLNGAEFKTEFPHTGQDVKVFAFRRDEDVALTVAMPLHARATASERAYFEAKDAIVARLSRRFAVVPLAIEWRLNNLDAPGRGTEGVYLSVTGTSAEDADSGQVGRGNGANGLIAFSRPSGGEAAPGKNAVAHAGKLYSVLAHRLARLVHAEVPGLVEVYVHLASRIGEPVDRPWTGVQLRLADGVRVEDVEARVRDTVERELARMAAFRAELLRGEHEVC